MTDFLASVNKNKTAIHIIKQLQDHINHMGFTPCLHFELEGCYVPPTTQFQLDYERINKQLKQADILGQLKPEYWQHQWEFVSDFAGQTPLEEALSLSLFCQSIPTLFQEQGIKKTIISPVVWAGDTGRLANDCELIFTHETKPVHIPNAIQLNISALDTNHENIISKHHFGEYLQQCLIETSLEHAILYLPEHDAYQRLSLKNDYGLNAELSSPSDISGGHQGSIALYKELGKHNQAMGINPLFVDTNNHILIAEQNWQPEARIEHRLGASSLQYNPFVNVIYTLLNLINALTVYQTGRCKEQLKTSNKPSPLPTTLFPDPLNINRNNISALQLFMESSWLSDNIDRYCDGASLGKQIKDQIEHQYQQPLILL